MLAPYLPELIERAFTEHLQESEFFPKPAEIKRKLDAWRDEQRRQKETSEVTRKMREWREEWDAEAEERAKWLAEEAQKTADQKAMDATNLEDRRQELQRQKVFLSTNNVQ